MKMLAGAFPPGGSRVEFAFRLVQVVDNSVPHSWRTEAKSFLTLNLARVGLSLFPGAGSIPSHTHVPSSSKGGLFCPIQKKNNTLLVAQSKLSSPG